MEHSPSNARATLLGADHDTFPLTGAEARILLFDSGLGSQPSFGGRLRNLAPLQGLPAACTAGTGHALRGASICAEGVEARLLAGGPLGIAPRATILSAHYDPLLPVGFADFLAMVVRDHGRIDVTGHAYSVEEDHYLAHEGRASFDELADADEQLSSVVIAAAGHDGPARVRFPASTESVIAVGVQDEYGRPAAYCGAAPELRKPELMVPNRHYWARLESGELGTLSGTSAAVAIVAGLAALWCERLRRLGLAPAPALVRAALIAGSLESGESAHRIAAAVPELRDGSGVFAVYEPLAADRHLRFELFVSQSGTLRVAAVLRRGRRQTLWVPVPPVVQLNLSTSRASIRFSDPNWTRAEIEVRAGERVAVEVNIEGLADGVAVVCLGGQAVGSRSEPARPRSHPKRSRTVLGISASHDASACLIRNGKLEFAVQLERITRIKHDGRGYLHSREAADYCLHAAGLRPHDVDLFAFNAQPLLPGYVGLSQPAADESFDLFDLFGDRAVFVSHHLAHAFAAFFASPFDEAAVFIADGSGGSTVGKADLILRGPELLTYLTLPVTARPRLHVQSTYQFTRTSYQLIDREYAESFNVRCGSSSLGEAYAAVSQYVFGDWREGGKLMGLAPYGVPEACGASFLQPDASGLLQFSANWKNRFCRTESNGDPLAHRHLAARVQRDLELALLERVKRVIELTSAENLAYSGGLALNSVANERIKTRTGIGRLFVLPASSDAGIAIGCAAAAEFLLTGATKGQPYTSDFLGYPYRQLDYDLALSVYRSCLQIEPAKIEDVARRLTSRQVIGWFEGRSEFGPRALGHRSILADPRDAAMWRFVNRRVKFREEFRPFAPAVPVELASEYFEIDGPEPYMLRVVRVREKYRKKLAAVTHVDGSARLQTVDREVLPRFHALLTAFGEKTGLPVLMNTSLNPPGQSIVETPLQAIELLLSTHLSALVLGDRLASPRESLRDGLTLRSKVRLAPDTQVTCEPTPSGPRARLVAAGRKGGQDVEAWLFHLLASADGETPVAELLRRFLPDSLPTSEALKRLEAYRILRLLIYQGEA